MSEESKVVAKRSQSWVLRSAPRHWDADDVVRFVQAAKFTAVELNEKKREKEGTTCGKKAFSESSQNYLQLLYEGSSFDDGRFVVVERYRNPRLLSSVTKLKGEFRVDLRQEPPSPDDFPPLVTTSVETEELEEKPAPDSQDIAMDETDGGKRATTVSVGASPDRKRLKVQPLPEGVLRVSNEGLGNCLFIAVAQSVEASSQQQHSHRSIRTAAVKHLRKHRDQYFMWWDNLWPDGSKCEKETIHGFDEYIGKVAQVGAWAGNLEVAALATMDRPIYVLHETGQVYSFCPPGSRTGKRVVSSFFCSKRSSSTSQEPDFSIDNSWQKNLVADGDVEPNPGPSSWRGLTLNSGSRDSTWSFVKLVCSRQLAADVVFLQETFLDPSALSSMTQHAGLSGFRLWTTAPSEVGGQFRGGGAVLVRASIHARLWSVFSARSGQVVAVALKDVIGKGTVNLQKPMTFLGSLVSWLLLKQMFMAWAWFWLVIGIGLRQKMCYSILMSFPCSRCKITRALSPLVGRAPVLWTMSCGFINEAFGDHKGLLFEIRGVLPEGRCFSRLKTKQYSCPQHGGDSPSERLGSLTRMSSKAMMRSTLSWNGTGSMPNLSECFLNLVLHRLLACGRRVACLRFFQLLTFGFVVFDMVLSEKDLFGSFLAG